MKNYKEIVKKLTQKSKMQIITKGYQKGYICQQDNKIHAQIACIYTVVSQQKYIFRNYMKSRRGVYCKLLFSR